MKSLYGALIVAIMIGFSGCTGASEEQGALNRDNPTITLAGDSTITLAVGQLINEPGYTASDARDGDLTNSVTVKSDLDFYKTGTYYVNYFVTDSDGYTATANRTIYVTQDGSDSGQYSGDYQYGDVGSVYYDFATYNYNYHVREEGTTVTQSMYDYDANGELIITEVVFERNANDGSIYEYNNNLIESRDYIGIDQIQSVDSDSNIVTMKRHIRASEVFVDATMNGVQITCKLVEHVGAINTQTVTGVNIMNFNYTDVLHTQCTGTNGFTTDSYFANGWGEVLTITQFNGATEYSILDKNSMQTVN